MANIKSQKKRIKTNEKRRLRNRGALSAIRTHIRGVERAVELGDKEAATDALREAGRQLDKAASQGTVHRNYASRQKSRLARKVGSSG